MVMTMSLLSICLLVMVPFMLASARHVVLRRGRPEWLRRRLAARRPRTGVGLGATAIEELHAFLNANKRVQLEQRHVEQIARSDVQDGAPPHVGVDLDAGRAVVRRRDGRQS
ncbi:DUF6191 domain-containing protein [Streptomyces sp. 8N616]|uniref:DUF6191 domain-containing protein n=1 Tax=Streptomyces sp. 8N616 TaxID=3457414 RepID=UPI003FCF9563